MMNEKSIFETTALTSIDKHGHRSIYGVVDYVSPNYPYEEEGDRTYYISQIEANCASYCASFRQVADYMTVDKPTPDILHLYEAQSKRNLAGCENIDLTTMLDRAEENINRLLDELAKRNWETPEKWRSTYIRTTQETELHNSCCHRLGLYARIVPIPDELRVRINAAISD